MEFTLIDEVWKFYLFKLLLFVLLCTLQEVQQYYVTKHCALENNYSINIKKKHTNNKCVKYTVKQYF